MNLSFQYIWILTALALIPMLILLYFSLKRWRNKITTQLGGIHVLRRLVENYSPHAFRIKFILTTLALSLIILGAANLRAPGGMDNVTRKGVDIIIALDVSKSMLAEDISPNRLERAKLFLRQLITRLPEDRIGLVLFAGRAYLQMPLSIDHASVLMYLQQADPGSVPSQGTVIAEALNLSNMAFNSKERKYKALVMITDGEDHDPEALPAAEELTRNGVMINTIGIGSVEGTTVPEPATGEPKRDAGGNIVISKLNEAELQNLATISNGVYIHLNDTEDAVEKLKTQLNTIERTAMEDKAFITYKNYFQWFIGLALLLLVVEFMMPEKKWGFRWKKIS